MDSKFIWNYIVEQHKKNLHAPESVAQKEWEMFFSELFGYSSLFGEIVPQPTIHIGSGKSTIPDIIIKKTGVSLFDVELKQYSLSFDERMEDQLLSYMKLLEISVGVLVCNKLYVYIYSDKITKNVEIDFTKDNPDGIKFVEMFRKDSFSFENIEVFIDSKNNFDENIRRIKKELNSSIVVDLVKRYFESFYTVEEIEEAFKDILIEVKNKDQKSGGISLPPPPPPPPYSRFAFEGNEYNKCKLVLAVVRAYVRDNPSITYYELKEVFYDKLQGSTGVVVTPKDLSIKRHCSDPDKRYFTRQPIYLNNDEVWVSTQWGIGNIYNFINKARCLGYEIIESN